MVQLLILALFCGIAQPTASNVTSDESDEAWRRRAFLSNDSYPPGVDDESEYADWLAEQAESMRRVAEESESRETIFTQKLAVVNWVLSRQCEPALSRLLQGIELPGDATRVAELAERCSVDLKALRPLLDDLSADDLADSSQVHEWEDSLDVLESFAIAFAAYCDSSPGANDLLSEAAMALSINLEDERAEVAAAALLWQAALYGRNGDEERLSRLLPLVTVSPRPESLVFDFFVRYLRCDGLRRRGAYSTAWTLLLVLEEKSRDWFGLTERRDEAGRSAVLLKLHICHDWPGAAPESQRDSVRGWCDQNGRRLSDEYFGHDGGNVLRLTTAIPIIALPPEPAGNNNVSPPTIESPEAGHVDDPIETPQPKVKDSESEIDEPDPPDGEPENVPPGH